MLGGREIADIEDVTFYLDDGIGYSSVHSEDLFDVYEVLDPAIDSNYERNLENRKKQSVMGPENKTETQRNQWIAEEVGEEWSRALEGYDAYAEVDFGDETETFDVYPRRDFGIDEILSRPNVVFLEGQKSNRKMALRHWRPHESDIASYVYRMKGGFKRTQHDDNAYKSLGSEDFDPRDFTESILFVDERDLQTALNGEGRIYDQFRDDDHFVPVTPNRITLADIGDDGSAYALRPFMIKEFDGGPDPETDGRRFGRYYANIANLGLMNYFDRELGEEFFADTYPGHNGNFTVDVDNEFVAYVRDKGHFTGGEDHQEFRKDAIKTLTEKLGEPRDVAESFLDAWSDEFVQEFPQTPDIEFLDHVPHGFDSDLFSRDKKVETRV